MRRIAQTLRFRGARCMSQEEAQEFAQLKQRVQWLEDLLHAKRGMHYRTLGNTGLEVSAVSLGCAPLGNVYGDINTDAARQLVHTAVERGVNLFDTSPYYGATTSESVLGQCLKGIPRDKYYLATKVGRYHDHVDYSTATVRRSVQESMDRLQVDHIDIIQCHDIEFSSSLDQVIHEALPALEEMRQEGKVSYIGITGLPLGVLDYVLESSDVHIDTILSYCCYVLNNNNLLQYLPRWKHRGLGVIQGGAMSLGLLTPQGPPPWHPAPDVIKEVCAEAVKACEGLNRDIAKLAFQYTFGMRDIQTTLVGATTVEQLERSLQWMHDPIDEEVLHIVETTLAPIKNKMWVEKGSEENIALAYGGYWARGRKNDKLIQGSSVNLGE